MEFLLVLQYLTLNRKLCQNKHFKGKIDITYFIILEAFRDIVPLIFSHLHENDSLR